MGKALGNIDFPPIIYYLPRAIPTRSADFLDWYKQGVVQWQTKLGLRMGKALGNIDFPRFFNKKINNSLTMIDMDLIFFT